MKWQIQQKLQKEYAGTSDDQAHKSQMEKVYKNPVLGNFIQTIKTFDLHKQS
jgi:hypothetical protein